MAKALLVVVVLLCFCDFSYLLGCIGDDGNPVDWWIALKSPKRRSVKDPNVASGLGYAYMDNTNIKKNFTLNKKALDDSKSCLARTLSVLYSGSKGVGYGMYNDNAPGKNASSYWAHAKGVFGFDKAGGFWLIHSLPDFPGKPSEEKRFSIPESQLTYGQSLFCISLSPALMNKVGNNVNTYNAQFYEYVVPASLANQYTELAQTMNKTWKVEDQQTVINFTLPSGFTLTHFAKNAKWGEDLYADWVSPYFKTGLLVETWMRPVEPSTYPPDAKYEIVNVNSVKFSGLDDSFAWEETSDHSKWTISTLPSRGLFCIGDINKQKSQRKRGGGTLCAVNCDVYQAFLSLIVESDKFTVPEKEKTCKKRREDEAEGKREVEANKSALVRIDIR
eukprot:TRINITY_DN2695_c0_g1_i1.p1 TRINITY_DN2695_c0_g1~~TRINITY_DN2695_c0_g1_i1.p1  ORF type:complete len:401 (-),score=83.43 TRINITY_DN2695_c0_g1_i1:272-1441(-)